MPVLLLLLLLSKFIGHPPDVSKQIAKIQTIKADKAAMFLTLIFTPFVFGYLKFLTLLNALAQFVFPIPQMHNLIETFLISFIKRKIQSQR
jgi:hypothetical protein